MNISAKSASDRNAQLTVDDLTKWEDEHGTIPDKSILFVFSDWGKYWPSYEKYFGTSTTNSSLYRFPGTIYWSRARDIRDLKIDVYGKRLTSDTLFAIKTKSLTVKCFTYGIYSKYRELRIETLCLRTET